MLPLRRILNGCRNLFRKEAVEGELDAEVQAFSILKQGLGAAAMGRSSPAAWPQQPSLP